MIRLTSHTSGKSIHVNPNLIKVIIEDNNCTWLHFGHGDDAVRVTESQSEIARKVLEYKLATINAYHDGSYSTSRNKLLGLAGLEDTNDA